MIAGLLDLLAASVEAALANRKLPVGRILWILAALILALVLYLAFA